MAPRRVLPAWLLCLVAGLSTPAPVFPQAPPPPDTVYSGEFERGSGAPQVHRHAFDVCDPHAAFQLVVDNGPDGTARVASAVVWVNGVPVIRERDLNQQVDRVIRAVQLERSNELQVQLAGGPGGRVRVRVGGDAPPPRVTITSPADGAALDEPATLVTGEIESACPAGVRLSVTVTIGDGSVEAAVPTRAHGPSFAAWVPLAPGTNRLVASASDAAGRATEHALSVSFFPGTPEEARGSRPDVSPTVGFAPLAVTFGGRAATDPDVDRLDLDVDGDGHPDFGLADFAGPPHAVTHTYRVEGLYVASLATRDRATGRTWTERVPIAVISRPDLRGVWNAFRTALGRGDVEAALRHVSDEARARYRRVFEDLRTGLAVVAPTLGDLVPHVVAPDYATGSAARVRDGRTEVFVISFVRDADGVWRIASL